MPSITLVSTYISEQRANRTAHVEIDGTQQTLSCTSVADAAAKLTTALTPLVGGGTAATHATAFTARQNGFYAPSKHVINLGAGQGMTATYHP